MGLFNQIIIKTMPIVPKSVAHMFAKKYIAGDTLQDAVQVTKKLESIGGMSTIDVLGEFVTEKKRAIHEKNQAKDVVQAIKSNSLKSYLSLKPTSLGLDIDEEFAYSNIKEVLEFAKKNDIFVRLDMENSPYTTKTLNLYKRYRDEGFDNVGFVIQAYMKRSFDDVSSLLSYKPTIRLCKGIYNEDPSIAYKGFTEIQDNYKKLLDLMLDNDLYVGIATHDEELLVYALDQLENRKTAKERYEFQMLLGVRENRRDEIIKAGHRLRVYVPYGADWYGYSTRRLKENPKMAGHVVKSIFGID